MLPSYLGTINSAIAVLWPTGGLPVIVAAYITGCTGPESKRPAMLAEIGRLVRESVAPLPHGA